MKKTKYRRLAAMAASLMKKMPIRLPQMMKPIKVRPLQ